MNRHRILLALRTIDVSYRSALRHADPGAADFVEWLDATRRRAEHSLNALESSWIHGGLREPDVEIRFRYVREAVRRAHEEARTLAGSVSESARETDTG